MPLGQFLEAVGVAEHVGERHQHMDGVVDLRPAAERLALGDLRSADIHGNTELDLEPLNDELEMKFVRALKDSLTGLPVDHHADRSIDRRKHFRDDPVEPVPHRLDQGGKADADDADHDGQADLGSDDIQQPGARVPWRKLLAMIRVTVGPGTITITRQANRSGV
jgi:hypothetical protein